MPDAELRERYKELFESLYKSRFYSYDEEAKNPGQARTWKREIARINTILTERGVKVK
jgi:ribosomal protein L29